MPKTTPAEWLLARFTTPDRAAAILGDLTEIATTRGNLWFWAAYLRTLLSLTWRGPAAFVVGLASLTALYRLRNFGTFHHRPFAWDRLAHPYIQQAVFYLAVQLWFLVPFAVARYGSRDRLARVGLPIVLAMTGVIFNVPLLSPILAVAGIAAIAGSLAYDRWRRPAIMLVATSVIGAFTLLNLGFLAHMACWIDEHKPLNASSHYRFFEVGFAFPHTLFWVVVWTMVLLNTLVTSLVCSRLHRRFVEAPPSGVVHA